MITDNQKFLLSEKCDFSNSANDFVVCVSFFGAFFVVYVLNRALKSFLKTKCSQNISNQENTKIEYRVDRICQILKTYFERNHNYLVCLAAVGKKLMSVLKMPLNTKMYRLKRIKIKI